MCAERLLGGQRGSDVKGCSTHRPLQQNPFWLRDACSHMGGSWDTPHVDCDTRYIRMTGQGKPRKKCTIKVILTAMRWTQGLTPECRVPISTYCTPSPLNKYFSLFSAFCLCGNSFPQSWMARALSLTTGLEARIWCSHRPDPATISGQGTEALLQDAAGRGHQDQFEMNFEG